MNPNYQAYLKRLQLQRKLGELKMKQYRKSPTPSSIQALENMSDKALETVTIENLYKTVDDLKNIITMDTSSQTKNEIVKNSVKTVEEALNKMLKSGKVDPQKIKGLKEYVDKKSDEYIKAIEEHRLEKEITPLDNIVRSIEYKPPKTDTTTQSQPPATIEQKPSNALRDVTFAKMDREMQDLGEDGLVDYSPQQIEKNVKDIFKIMERISSPFMHDSRVKDALQNVNTIGFMMSINWEKMSGRQRLENWNEYMETLRKLQNILSIFTTPQASSSPEPRNPMDATSTYERAPTASTTDLNQMMENLAVEESPTVEEVEDPEVNPSDKSFLTEILANLENIFPNNDTDIASVRRVLADTADKNRFYKARTSIKDMLARLLKPIYKGLEEIEAHNISISGLQTANRLMKEADTPMSQWKNMGAKKQNSLISELFQSVVSLNGTLNRFEHPSEIRSSTDALVQEPEDFPAPAGDLQDVEQQSLNENESETETDFESESSDEKPPSRIPPGSMPAPKPKPKGKKGSKGRKKGKGEDKNFKIIKF